MDLTCGSGLFYNKVLNNCLFLIVTKLHKKVKNSDPKKSKLLHKTNYVNPRNIP